LPDYLNPKWVSGFTAGDGGFSIGIRPSLNLLAQQEKTNPIYFRFHIAQHSRDAALLELFIKFFGFVRKREKFMCDQIKVDVIIMYKIFQIFIKL
jgi:hypothetical protein